MAAFPAVSKRFPEASAVPVVFPDVVVDGLVGELGALPGPEQHLDLFGTEALVEQVEHLVFEMATDLARSVLAPEQRPPLSHVGIVVATREGVATELPGNRAGSPVKSAGHLSDGSSVIAHGSDADTFCLAEVSVVDHWFGCLCDD